MSRNEERLETGYSRQEIDQSEQQLRRTHYAGRIVMVGLNRSGSDFLQVAVLSGRSDTSRARTYIEVPGGIRTAAPGMTAAEMEQVQNANLIYYPVMGSRTGIHVVSNGAQTPHLLSAMTRGAGLDTAVRLAPKQGNADLASYEPDQYNTPRIAGAIDPTIYSRTPFGLSIIRKAEYSNQPEYGYWSLPLKDLEEGVGFGIQTYAAEGENLPSYTGRPYPLHFGEGAEDTAEHVWDLLDPATRVAIVVKQIPWTNEENISHSGKTYAIKDIHSVGETAMMRSA